MGIRGIMNDVLRHHVGLDNQEVRLPLYVAGCFGSDPTNNTQIAIQVGKVAQKKGFAPFVPHTSILSGVYGCDDIPQERTDGMVSTLSLLASFAKQPTAHLWVIEKKDGTRSQGTQMEFEVWCQIREGLGFPPNWEQKKAHQWLNDE